MKATHEEVVNFLKGILINNLNLPLMMDEIDENESLFTDGLELDSVDMLEVVSGVDDEYNVVLTNEDREHFETLSKLSDYIISKI